MEFRMSETTTVLIVDDDEEIRELLRTYLAGFSIRAETVGDGVAMREAMTRTRFDVIVLDLMLPGEDGLSLCRQLRMTTDIPIVILTARGEAADRVVGLELGADDYVMKPFDPRELVARIHTILRRVRDGSKRETADVQDEWRFEGWSINRVSRQLVTPRQMIVPLSNAEFRLLTVFIERPRRVLSRDQLMDAARGHSAAPFDRSIDLLVSRLRQKLDDDPKDPKLLKTVRGEGYLFDAKVTR
jgi:two-component system OmpR family response regulator